MKTDELRAELAELAGEVDPFPGDLTGARRRVARRRALVGVVAVAVSIALVATVVAVTRSNPRRIHVAGTDKAVAIAHLPRVDSLVVLPAHASDADVAHVETILGLTSTVEKYAPVAASTVALVLTFKKGKDAAALRARVCRAPSTRTFAVELTHAARDPLPQMTSAIGTAATVLSVGTGADIEVFMDLKATVSQVAAVRARIAADPDITSYRFVSRQAAYREFKKLFSDQPAIIASTAPDTLPESFRLEVRDGASIPAVAQSLHRMPGVDQVNSSSNELWANPARFLPADQVEIFMQVKASEPQIAAVRTALTHDPLVSSSVFLSHEDAYNQFKLEYADQPDLIRSTSAAALPTSFVVTLVNARDSTAFERRYAPYAGVDQVVIPHSALAQACSPSP